MGPYGVPTETPNDPIWLPWLQRIPHIDHLSYGYPVTVTVHTHDPTHRGTYTDPLGRYRDTPTEGYHTPYHMVWCILPVRRPTGIPTVMVCIPLTAPPYHGMHHDVVVVGIYPPTISVAMVVHPMVILMVWGPYPMVSRTMYYG